MDLRVKRTRKRIADAFIRLRAKQPLDKITVTELAKLAEINKATFYLHYKDIYDLADHLENEILDECLAEIPFKAFFNHDAFRLMAMSFESHSELLTILFSGDRVDHAVRKLEEKLKTLIFERRPDLADNLIVNVQLTASIYGGFHSFFKYKDEDFETVITALSEVCTGRVLPKYLEPEE